MKKWTFFVLLFFLSGLACANPVVYPSISDGGFLVVLISASVVEVSVVALILFCFDLALKPVWAVLFVGNIIIYYMIFLPLLDSASSLLVVEGLIVAADGIMIKVISLFDLFQMQTFTGLRWRYAFIIAAVGNVISYYLGAVMQA